MGTCIHVMHMQQKHTYTYIIKNKIDSKNVSRLNLYLKNKTKQYVDYLQEIHFVCACI